MLTSIATPLISFITALSLLPLTACIPAAVPEVTVPPSETPPSITETAEYGVPLAEHAPVDDNWFKNSAIIGHSLIMGLADYSGLKTPDYYYLSGSSSRTILSSSSVTLPNNKVGTLESGLSGKSYERIYLMLGINEVPGIIGALKNDYLNFLKVVRKYNPDAEIFVLAVLPVTRNIDVRGTFTIEKILTYNDMLKEVCAEENCWYVDLYTGFADEEGFLPSAVSSDGIHLHVGVYKNMLDYIRSHTKTK